MANLAAAKIVARKLATIPTVSTLTGLYVSTNPDGTVQVDFGQGPVPVYSAGFYTPLPGDSVRVVKLNAFTLMLGPVVPEFAYGRVTATGSPKLTVAFADGTSEALFYMVSAYPSPAVNDDVLINRASGGMILGKVSGVPVSGYLPPVAPIGASQSFAVDFRATDSGSYDHSYGSWFQNDVWASVHANGVWFYGSSIADTISDTATITAVRVYAPEFYAVGGDTAIGVHSLAGKTGAPTVTSAVPITGGGWLTLPTAFGDALKTGAASGVGTVTGNYFHKYRGRATDAQSGLLHIEWRA